MELKTLSGSKIKFHGLSLNAGEVWVEWDGRVNHIKINDLDPNSKEKVLKIISEEEEKSRKERDSVNKIFNIKENQ